VNVNGSIKALPHTIGLTAEESGGHYVHTFRIAEIGKCLQQCDSTRELRAGTVGYLLFAVKYDIGYENCKLIKDKGEAKA
jgi:translation elongation factor EF-4